MTTHFSQGRDLDRPLVGIPADAGRFERLGLRLYAGYVWFVFGFCVLAIVLWAIGIVLV